MPLNRNPGVRRRRPRCRGRHNRPGEPGCARSAGPAARRADLPL